MSFATHTAAMREGGHHLVLDLAGCDPRLLASRVAMSRLCRELGRVIQARVLETRSFKFRPWGVTSFSILAESHVSVHTWPESGKAFVDVFTCQNRFASDPVIDRAIALLRAKSATVTHLYRDVAFTRLLFHGRIETGRAGFDFGRTIFSFHSLHQHIELTRGPLGVSLFLNGYWQFVEKYERVYHETLIHPAAVCAPRLRRVGIAGGGDGLALREVLRYPTLDRVWLYDIDTAVLSLADSHPEMLRLNEGALRHPKAQAVAADARRMLVPGADLDLLVIDFPSMSDGGDFSDLYASSFYRQAGRALRPDDGVLVVQVSDYPRTIERVAARLSRLFPYVVPVAVGKVVSVYSFVLAGWSPLRPRRPLPPGLSFMTDDKLKALLHLPMSTASRPAS